MTVPVTIDPRYYDAVIFTLTVRRLMRPAIDAAAWTQSADGVPVFESAIALDAGVRTAASSHWSRSPSTWRQNLPTMP